jgi:hypothetical protein
MSVIGATFDGCRCRTTAFFSFPLYCCRSSFVFALRMTTSPVTFPLVLPDHPAAATISDRPVSGSTIFMLAVPRSHATGISHGSSRTFSSPYSRIFSAVQWFAFSICFDPVSRGPITSDRYCRFAISWVFALISEIRAWSRAAGVIVLLTAAGAPWARGAGAGSAASARARTRHTSGSARAVRRRPRRAGAAGADMGTAPGGPDEGTTRPGERGASGWEKRPEPALWPTRKPPATGRGGGSQNRFIFRVRTVSGDPRA